MILLLPIYLLATTPQEAPQPTAEPAAAQSLPVACAKLDVAGPLTSDQLESAKLCREISKLQEEVESLREVNRTNSSKFGFLIPWSGLLTTLISGAVALIVSVFGYRFRQSFDTAQARKLDQERTIQREEHNIKLMAGLGSVNRTKQLAAAASILGRVREITGAGDSVAAKSNAQASELKVLSDVMIAVIRDPKLNDAVAKYIAEEVVAVFKLRAPAAPGKPGAESFKPLLNLSDYNLSGAKLKNVWWARVVAENVDFFEADLSEASLRDARLKGVRFYETNLQKAVLIGADLSGANFEGAKLQGARLTNARLDGAINIDKALWDETTLWPEGFSLPARQGAEIA